MATWCSKYSFNLTFTWGFPSFGDLMSLKTELRDAVGALLGLPLAISASLIPVQQCIARGQQATFSVCGSLCAVTASGQGCVTGDLCNLTFSGNLQFGWCGAPSGSVTLSVTYWACA
jgi:hypothetical protein